MGKLNFRGYLISRFSPTREIRENLTHAKKMRFTVLYRVSGMCRRKRRTPSPPETIAPAQHRQRHHQESVFAVASPVYDETVDVDDEMYLHSNGAPAGAVTPDLRQHKDDATRKSVYMYRPNDP